MQKLIKAFFLSCILLQIVAVMVFSNGSINPKLAFAWETNQSAEAECVLNPDEDINYAKIRVRFTNKDSKAMNVTAQDNQTGKTVDFPTIQPGQTHTRSIQTRQKSIANGTVTISLTWAEGASGSDKRTVSYNAIKCNQPVVVPTSTPTPAPTVVPATPTPTAIPTSVPAPTSTPVPTSIPQVINNVQANATATNNVTVQQVQQVQQIQQVQQVQQSAPKPPQVLAAVKVTKLPKTGAQDNILFGLFSLIPAGLFMIKKSKSMLQG